MSDRPAAALAMLRLRRRNLAPILEASGWAINAPLRLTRALRDIAAEEPKRPAGSARHRTDRARLNMRARTGRPGAGAAGPRE